jgi:ribosome-associated translation inhibitor RaiA
MTKRSDFLHDKLPAERRLNVQFDAHHCELRQAVIDKMHTGLDSLSRQVANFPFADLHVLVEHTARTNDYSVKLTLRLPGSTLVGNDHDPLLHPAFERCVLGLEENVRAYKDRLDKVEERAKVEKGTHQGLEPSVDPDAAALERAAREGDYNAFRTATFGYEEAVRKRAGRWVERYPEVQARIGKGLTIDDVVEEVFLTAFDQYDRRPTGVRLGDWLDGLIDPAVKALQRNGDEELENINLARSARAAERGPGAG